MAAVIDFEKTLDALLFGSALKELTAADPRTWAAARALLDGETVVVKLRGSVIRRYALPPAATGPEAPSVPRTEG